MAQAPTETGANAALPTVKVDVISTDDRTRRAVRVNGAVVGHIAYRETPFQQAWHWQPASASAVRLGHLWHTAWRTIAEATAAIAAAVEVDTGRTDALGRRVFVDRYGRRAWQASDYDRPVGLTADEWYRMRQVHGPVTCG